MGTWPEELLGRWVLGSQLVGTAAARCGSRLRLRRAIRDRRLASYCQTRGLFTPAKMNFQLRPAPPSPTAKVSGEERAGQGSAPAGFPLGRGEPGAMAERRAAAKGRRMGSSRRKQLREGSGEAPAAAPSPGEEPASEIIQRVQEFFRQQDMDQAGFVTRSDMQVRDGDVFSGQMPPRCLQTG